MQGVRPILSIARTVSCLFGLSFLSACTNQEDSDGVFVIYDSSNGPVKGWSHIVTDPEGFPLVAKKTEAYAVEERSMVKDSGLGGENVFRTILVRKLSDWGRQHANGIEPVFSDRPVKVGDLKFVRLRLRINSQDSMILDLDALTDRYSGHLSPDQVRELDEGIACLGLTFVEAGYNDQDSESLNAFYYIRFDPENDYDRWLELEIPLTDFTFGFEKNYSLREVSREEVLDHEFIAFRINPEGTGGKVARNFLSDVWDGSVPEIYKETSISLRRIETVVTKSEE